MYGCGVVDMKFGDVVFFYLVVILVELMYDLILVFYDCEEIDLVVNGLGCI